MVRRHIDDLRSMSYHFTDRTLNEDDVKSLKENRGILISSLRKETHRKEVFGTIYHEGQPVQAKGYVNAKAYPCYVADVFRYKKIYVELLLENSPIFRKYQSSFEVYANSGDFSNLLFLKTDSGYLYVPVEALMTGDIKAIITKHIAYFLDYYHITAKNNNSTRRLEHYRKNTTGVFNTPLCSAFLHDLKGGAVV
ncbi:hypothetical protein HNP86_001807 [Methanococcus maripaludis]|uniref:Uncharacterized protein n=1 Tax=Methanococcus maripaludis TaxID=39152 RepID=A0A7J9NVE5_METMI|nr:hypothetical protein [Methanococcus maripaludis]MBA2851648.1 hypothetical protein [Methanococcus maripaludis]